MKTVKKLILIILTITTSVLACFGLVSCKNGNNSADTIYISVINKGYGTNWIDKMMKTFLSSHSEYSQYKYEIINSYDDDSVKTSVESGLKYCNYDLVFHAGGSNLISDEYLEDLSPVYDMQYKSGKLVDYMDESLVSNFVREKNGTKYYNYLPWTKGGSGLLVNYDIVSSKLGANWENTYPCRTTNEFMEFINALTSKNVQPFVILTNRDFYGSLYDAWWAQYEGMEGVENYYYARYEDIMGEMQEGPEAFLQEGVLQSLKVMEKIFSNPKNYGNIYENWNTMQAAYMEGKSAMIVNGPWMNIEMTEKLKYKNIDMRFIKTPIISALGAKLKLSEFTKTTGEDNGDIIYNITDESKLLEVIDYVDGKTSVKPQGVSEDIITRIKDARRMVVSPLDYSNACIPNFSTKKAVTLEFLKWMYSEEGHKEYIIATSGLTLPVQNTIVEDNNIELNNFALSHKNFTEDAMFIYGNMSWKYSKAGLIPFAARTIGPIEYLLTGESGFKIDGKEAKTAYAIYKYNGSYYTKNWNLLVNAAK